MKLKTLFFVLIIINQSFTTVAQQKKLSDKEVQFVGYGLCTEIMLADTSGFDANRFEKLILDT